MLQRKDIARLIGISTATCVAVAKAWFSAKTRHHG